LDGTKDLSEMFDNRWNEIDKILFLSKKVLIDTAKPVGSACIDEHRNATNVSRIIATLWPIHKSLQNCVTSIHGFRYIATSIHQIRFLRERNCRSFDDLVLSVRLFEQKMTPDYCRRYINHLKVVLKAILEKNGNWSDH